MIAANDDDTDFPLLKGLQARGMAPMDADALAAWTADADAAMARLAPNSAAARALTWVINATLLAHADEWRQRIADAADQLHLLRGYPGGLASGRRKARQDFAAWLKAPADMVEYLVAVLMAHVEKIEDDRMLALIEDMKQQVRDRGGDPDRLLKDE